MRFGLLGTGHWAANTQAAALAAHPDAELVGVWGRDPVKAAALAERYGAQPYPDVDRLFAEVDAVAVALPPNVQADLAVRAATAGCHLLLDKPLALDRAAADRVVDAVDAAGVAGLVFFTRRYHAAIDAVLVEAARTGGWGGARATMFASIFHTGSPYGASQWRRDHGGLWDVGPHALSLILPVLGPVDRVAAMRGPHDTTYVLLSHVSGATSSMALSLDVAPAARTEEFVFHGTAGLLTVPPPDAPAVEAFGTAVDQLLAEVASGRREHPCGVRFGRDVVVVIAAAQVARDEGRIIQL